MDEKKETDEAKKEGKDKQSSEGADKGDKYETTPLIEKGRETAERMEAAIKAQRAENDRTERIRAEQRLGGETEAGQQAPEVSEDQKKIDNVLEYFDGTQLAIDIKKANE